MHIDALRERGDIHIRVYNCPACHHEMWLTVWDADTVTKGGSEDGRTDIGTRTRRQPVS
jgi:hypothetical protein